MLPLLELCCANIACRHSLRDRTQCGSSSSDVRSRSHQLQLASPSLELAPGPAPMTRHSRSQRSPHPRSSFDTEPLDIKAAGIWTIHKDEPEPLMVPGIQGFDIVISNWKSEVSSRISADL